MTTGLRTFGKLLAIGTILVAVVVTQWPFEYRFTSYALHLRWTRIDWSWFPRRHNGHLRIDRDLVQNVLMLIPLGVGYGLWRRAGGVRLLAECLVVGFVTSVALELAQLLTRDRYTSFPDVWHNALGCILGGVLALVARRAVIDPSGTRPSCA